MPQLRFVNVTKRFGRVMALDRISLEVSDGEYLCILGPTGSGKTTLLKLMAGLLRPDEGVIHFDGKPVNCYDAPVRNAVYVPQQYALFPHMTVLQNVAFGPLARGKPAPLALETASEALELVRLSSRSQSLPKELSGGMQQRVALARGLASGAKLLLLDEPLSAIDARLRLNLRHKIRDIVKQSGLTAVHVTHDQDEAMSVGDEVLVLKNGRIQDFGQPRRVYSRPAGIFVTHLFGGASFFEGVVEETVGMTALVSVSGGLRIQVPSRMLTPTSPVILAIRKERVRISIDQPLGMDNVFRGDVRSIRFLGNSREYLIRLSNGDRVTSRHLAAMGPIFKVGDELFVSFHENDVMVFDYPPQGLLKELEIG
jgi:ABC-type Fe3+/spermidine/putrescine transport system ATPase subunit